ncbi:MAG: restriction endonuclease subunit S [Desulfuromonas sp.]|nr:MAG: restriction endonuclease subunit S [Desulfuromonas sp.]
MTGWTTESLGQLCEIKTGRKDVNQGNPEGKYPFFTCAREHTFSDEFSFEGEALLIAGNGDVGNTSYFKGKFEAYQRTYVLMGFDRVLPRYLFRVLNGTLKNVLYDKKLGNTMPYIKKGMLTDFPIPLPPLPEQKRIVAILDEAFAGIDAAVANTEKNLANARELFESYLNAVFTQNGDGWVEKKLGEMCERVTKGSSPKWQGIEYVEKPGVLFVTSENVGTNQMLFNKIKYVEEAFNQKDSKSILKRGDVLTNIVGASIGRTAVYDRDDLANINQAVCLLRCEPDRLTNTYLAYLLNSPFFKQILHDNEIDNARANLSLGFFKGLTIPVPPVEKQVSIVAEIDALREQTQRLESIYQRKLEALAELKQSILQKAFAGELTALPEKQIEEAVA